MIWIASKSRQLQHDTRRLADVGGRAHDHATHRGDRAGLDGVRHGAIIDARRLCRHGLRCQRSRRGALRRRRRAGRGQPGRGRARREHRGLRRGECGTDRCHPVRQGWRGRDACERRRVRLLRHHGSGGGALPGSAAGSQRPALSRCADQRRGDPRGGRGAHHPRLRQPRGVRRSARRSKPWRRRSTSSATSPAPARPSR